MGDKCFLDSKIFFVIDESHLRLDHPELDQMATRFGFFSTESRTKRIDTPQSHCGGFHVQLAGLGQIGVFVKILRMEQVGRTFR
ncbi:Uncharacterised protein [Mycobacterium tuberculosis]|nr:Uncharacterised protein [Mycobacterium tuberculosis]